MPVSKKFKILSFVFLGIVTGLLNTQPAMSQREYVKSLDLQRYLGVWYEIARYPHKFEKNLVGVTATYSLQDNGNISVVNSGHLLTLGGRMKTAYGKAKFAGKEHNGHLKVSFFLFFYADYLILDLEENYQWAIIGSSSDNYLWILSKTPQMSPVTYKMLLEKVRSMGYDVSKLHRVVQDKD
jgi:apolipoprotein D and lipocalin family protein